MIAANIRNGGTQVMTTRFRFGWVLCMLAGLTSAAAGFAQEEFAPPQGKGRVVVIPSGKSGPEHYKTVAKDIAALGYDAVLYDSNAMRNSNGEALKTAIQQAQGMPHALPGKVAVVGFSAGGGLAIYYATQWPDLVAGVIAWYPATTFIKDVPGWAGRLKVPVLMFAGESDKFENCCLIGTAHTVADAAKSADKPFELITYPKTEHDFVKGGSHYKSESYSDALEKTAAKLKELLGS
jgi:dienelactone hydrolase